MYKSLKVDGFLRKIVKIDVLLYTMEKIITTDVHEHRKAGLFIRNT